MASPRLAVASFLGCLLLAACGMGGLEDLVPERSGDTGSSSTGGTSPSTGTAMSALEAKAAAEVFDLVNVERARVGLLPLGWSDEVADVAYEHAYDMEARDFFDHVNPDGQGPGDRMDEAGVPWRGLGENIAWGQDTARQAMGDWMASPGHRENILYPDFVDMGVGVRAKGGAYWVQVFRVR